MLKVSSVSYMHDSNLEKEHIIEVIHPGKLPSVKGGGGGGKSPKLLLLHKIVPTCF